MTRSRSNLCATALLTGALAVVACSTTSPTPDERPSQDDVAERTAVEDDEPEVEAPAVDEPQREPCDSPPPSSWPGFQGGGERSGATDAAAIETSRIRWQRSIGVQSWLNTPIIAGDLVIVGSSGSVWNRPDARDGVYAYRKDDGSVGWFDDARTDVNGVAYSDCRVFVTGDEGAAWSLDVRDGRRLWYRRFDAEKVYSHPLPVGNHVAVTTKTGNVFLLTAERGAIVWSKAFREEIRGGPSTDGEHLFIATTSGTVAALDVASGATKWEVDTGREIYATPTIAGDHIVLGYARETTGSKPALFTLSKSDGSEVWHASDPRNYRQSWANIRSSPAVHDGHLFWGEAYSNRVIKASLETGEVVWSSVQGACFFPHWPSPAVAGTTLYVPRHDGGVYALRADDGSCVWQLFLGDRRRAGKQFPKKLRESEWEKCRWHPRKASFFASPAVDEDGTVYVGTEGGYLFAIERADPERPRP